MILYDRLAHPDLLRVRARAHAERIYVGKRGAAHSMVQAEIAALMIAKAREGKTVVRLKGGDPLLFARASEELEASGRRAGSVSKSCRRSVHFPGVAAYTGVPLTYPESERRGGACHRP